MTARRLTPDERAALTGDPLTGGPFTRHVDLATFAECERMGWGHWNAGSWEVTESGRAALAFDNAAMALERIPT